MRIGIDIREICSTQAGGFRSYLSGMLSGLADAAITYSYVLYSSPGADLARITLPPDSTVVPVNGGRLWRDWVSLRRRVELDQLDVIHFPANYGLVGMRTPSVITLHDCISLGYATRCTSAKSELLRRYSAAMTRLSIPQASVVITVSDYSREQIVRHFGCPEKVIVTHGAARIPAAGSDDGAEAEGQPYLLAFASVDPRKNTAVVIEAFCVSSLPSRNCRLIVVASHPAARQMVQRQAARLGVEGLVEVRTKVDDASLRQLYRNSVAFVFPSLEEGFGLPPLEAMACGTAVLSSDRASMPEVLGDAAIWFDPADTADVAHKLDMIYDDQVLREQFREKALQRAAMFSWQETARGTLYAYERAAAGRGVDG